MYGEKLSSSYFLIFLQSNATLLHLSARYNRLLFIDPLVEAGADLNALDGSGRTPFAEACINGSREVAEKLVSMGANPLIQTKFVSHRFLMGSFVDTFYFSGPITS